MAEVIKKVDSIQQTRITVLEIDHYGSVAFAAYLNNELPNDVDHSIRSALEDRFPGAVNVSNLPIAYDNDVERLKESYLSGQVTSTLNIYLRTYSRKEILEHHLILKLHWANVYTDIRMPDLSVFKDCEEFDCNEIAGLVENVQPVE